MSRRPDNYFTCERSGLKLPRSQMVIESGTGLRVGRKYADPFPYTKFSHPQGRMDVRVGGDAFMQKHHRPDTNIQDEARMVVAEDSDVDYVVDEAFVPLYY